MNTSLKNSKPLLVGLTGGIGSGKTTVAKVFTAMRVPVFNSDDVAKEIVNTDKKVVKAIKDLFGDVYSNNKLDAKKVAAIVFNDKEALNKLNKIVHPKVAEQFNKWIKENQSASILIKEAAILIESGAYQQMDKIILVTAPNEIKIERVKKRDGISETKVKERMSKQLSDAEKLSYADFKIDNGGGKLVIPQVLKIMEEINNQ